jgi:hypothetical protein
MKIKKINKKLKFDYPNLKFATVVLIVASLHNTIGKFNYEYVWGGSNMNKRGICLAVGVVSASANQRQRDSIRAGWGRSQDICRLRFFIATSRDWSMVQKVLVYLRARFTCLLFSNNLFCALKIILLSFH